MKLLYFGRRYDEHSHEQFVPGDPSKRAFTYFVLTGGRFVYASALRLAVLKFILSMTVRNLARAKPDDGVSSSLLECDAIYSLGKRRVNALQLFR